MKVVLDGDYVFNYEMREPSSWSKESDLVDISDEDWNKNLEYVASFEEWQSWLGKLSEIEKKKKALA